jgi:poly-gamma-glutamate synthase PgsB/CapB
LLLVVLGWLESKALARARALIPIRIHVNGSRGKSSVTRLVATGLRKSGIRTIAKTTGAHPRIILEDGREAPLRRRGGANIREQISVIRLAARRRAQAIVLECNAIRPELQWVSEHRIVQSTIGVITNVRRDHTDVMGESSEEIAEALSRTVPAQGKLVTGDPRFFPFF